MSAVTGRWQRTPCRVMYTSLYSNPAMTNQSPQPPVLGFAAYSGTGKTTLLKQIIALLSAHGLRLATIKHSHHDFSIDQPGKDSYELHHAGSQQTLLTSKYRSALISENSSMQEPELGSTLTQLDLENIDLVLVEGFRHAEELIKIELHRPSLGKPTLFDKDDQIIAVATDAMLRTSLPVLDINRPQQIADFILDRLKLGFKSIT